MPSPAETLPTNLRIASRGSALALAQTTLVEALLGSHFPALITTRHIIQTSGDRFTDRPLAEMGGKGLFTREIDAALLNHEADIAVHSLKDVPSDMPEALVLAAVLPREDVRDVLLHKTQHLPSIHDLPQGAMLATCSPRRALQATALRPDLRIGIIRGNVPTRAQKAANGEVDSTLLAAAGMRRLGMSIEAMLSVEEMLPAICQGIVAIACRKDDHATRALLAQVTHPATHAVMLAERSMLAAMQGTCHSPIAGYAHWIDETHLQLDGFVCSTDGTQSARYSHQAPATHAEALGVEVANQLLREVPRECFC